MHDIHGQVLDTLAEIQERHEAVRELEKSLLDLHQIFLDMAVLVEAQGEQLDNIEAQVGSTAILPPPALQNRGISTNEHMHACTGTYTQSISSNFLPCRLSIWQICMCLPASLFGAG